MHKEIDRQCFLVLHFAGKANLTGYDAFAQFTKQLQHEYCAGQIGRRTFGVISLLCMQIIGDQMCCSQ